MDPFKKTWSLRLRQWRERVRPLAGLRGLHALILPVIVALLADVSGVSSYLNELLFYQPFHAFRAKLGAQPRPDPALRFVIADDLTIKRLGREPSFGEWQEVAKLLLASGFKRVIHLETASHRADGAAPVARTPGDGEIYAGAIPVLGANSRATAFSDVAPRLLVSVVPPPPRSLRSDAIIAPAPAVREGLDGLGHITVIGDGYPYGFFDGKDRMIPYVGLYAAGRLAFEGGILSSTKGRVPISTDGMLYVDHVSFRGALEQAVSAISFFEEGSLRADFATINARSRAKLEGGEVAILVASGFTGGRHMRSPVDGMVPSYMGLVSIASSTLRGVFLHVPVPPLAVVLAWCLVLAAGLTRLSPRGAMHAAVALVVVLVMGCVVLLQTRGWILPCVPLAVVSLVSWGVHAAHRLVVNLVAQAATDEQLKLGEAVQSMLLPTELSGRCAGWDYRLFFRPYGPMSGDWLQTFIADEVPGVGPMAVIAIGDVVGKGPSAALLTAVIASVWGAHSRQWTARGFDLDAFIVELDTVIFNTFRGHQNTTMSLAVLTRTEAQLVTITAPKWIMLEGKTSKLAPASAHGALGMYAKTPQYKVARIPARQGQVFVTYSDGVIDSSRARRSFQDGLEIEALPGEREACFQRVIELALTTGAESALPDDQSLVMLTRIEPGATDAMDSVA